MPSIQQLLFPDKADDAYDDHEAAADDEKLSCFAALSAAGDEQLIDRLYDAEPPLDFECLFGDEVTDEIAYAAPYLVRLEAESDFGQWVFSRIGHDDHSAVIAVVPAETDLSALRRHFRKLNFIESAEGEKRLFSYYIPSTLRLFAPVCDVKQLRQLFGPVVYFIIQSDTLGQVMKFSRNRFGALTTERITLTPSKRR